MSSVHSPTPGQGIMHVSFNQDCTCVALGSTEGVAIYNLESHLTCYKHAIGAVSIAEMLFCTSLVAFVGAGEQPTLTPRRLSVLNTSTQKIIQDMNFATRVLAVAMNRQRLVVVVEKKAYVYALHTLALLRSLETPDNAKGLCALGTCSEPTLLALPASDTTGLLRVYDLLQDGGDALCEIEAHKTPLAIMAWSPCGRLLASASTTGTVIRVHRLPTAAKVYTFRRGALNATIHSLAFSPAEVEPPAAGRVLQPRQPASAAAGMLSAVMKYSVADMVNPARSIAMVRLPCQGIPSACALIPCRKRSSPSPSNTPTLRRHTSLHSPVSHPHPDASQTAAPDSASDAALRRSSSGGGGAGAGCGSRRNSSGNATDPPESLDGSVGSDGDCITLMVANLDGLLYEYCVTDLGKASPGGAKSTLEGEWSMLGTVH
ncbi:MAG: hypothetical protein WDW36_009710 [Sanguina aurantia]